VEVLRQQVHLGHLAPDERLPAERTLAEQLAVSRVTLREALRVLEAEGYLIVRRGVSGGAFVNNESVLREIAARRISRDPSAALRILEFRDATEPVAARLAATRRTPTDLAGLTAALKTIRRNETAAKVRHAESLFILGVGHASHNAMLAKSIEDARAATFLLDPGGGSAHAYKLSLRETLLDALSGRKDGAAEEASRKLLNIDREQAQILGNIA
jgi:GntR family transcriptional regulator, transcriptional repressor for pyruvate dehydrogenase complex